MIKGKVYAFVKATTTTFLKITLHTKLNEGSVYKKASFDIDLL